MTLDARTEQLYKSLDDATLLALHSVLGAEYQHYSQALAKMAESVQQHTESALEDNERFRETLASFAVAADYTANPDFHAGLQEFRAGVRELEARSQNTAESGERHTLQLAIHTSALLIRQRWVADELAQRGLLPPFPPEVDSLG